MVKKKTTRAHKPRTSALEKLQPLEAQKVLHAVLKVHPELRREAEEIARSLVSDVSFEAIAENVEWDLESLDLDDLNSRAGKHRWGYVGPTEAAWELLHEAIDPTIAEMQRQLDLGLERGALETCKGLVLGLYGVRKTKNDGCLGWAPDFTWDTAAEILKKWHEGSGNKSKKELVFPRSFIDQHIPEWNSLVDRVLAPKRQGVSE